MRRTICTLSLAALLGSGGVVTAQSTTQPRPESTTPAAKEDIKVTGCLKEAPPLAGSASAGSGAKTFVLEVMAPHAGMPSNRSPETSRTETPDQTTRPAEKETYALMAMGKVDLSKHVNHVVELTGTKADMPGTGSASTSSPTGSTGTAAAAGKRPMFHVTALRMVSTDCTQTSQ